MTSEDVERIETELGLTLPEDYRRVLLDFPFQDLRGNDFAELYDHPSALIETNQRLRSGEKPWPSHLLFVGQSEEDPAYALDMSAQPSRILRIEQGRIEGAPVEAKSLELWIGKLKKKAHRAPRAVKAEKIVALSVLGLLVVILILAVLAVGFNWFGVEPYAPGVLQKEPEMWFLPPPPEKK